MIKAERIQFNNIDYLVMDTNRDIMNGQSVAKLTSYSIGVGADRVIFMDMESGSVIVVYNSKGERIIPDSSDFSVARASSDGIVLADSRRQEVRISNYFINKIMVSGKSVRIAC